MENKDDKALQDFFAAHKKEIDDNGFSRRVMNALPEKQKVRWIIPAFTLIGLVVTFLLVDLQSILMKIYLFVERLPLIYVVAVFFSIPFVCLAMWYVNEKEYRVFG